jgi:hypothetical protein
MSWDQVQGLIQVIRQWIPRFNAGQSASILYLTCGGGNESKMADAHAHKLMG